MLTVRPFDHESQGRKERPPFPPWVWKNKNQPGLLGKFGAADDERRLWEQRAVSKVKRADPACRNALSIRLAEPAN